VFVRGIFRPPSRAALQHLYQSVHVTLSVFLQHHYSITYYVILATYDRIRVFRRVLSAEPFIPPGDDLDKRLLELGTHDPNLPRPGELVLEDYRSDAVAGHAWAAAARGRPIRVVQWNIERGYAFAEILQTLRDLDADIIVLQEIDIGCDRSDGRDVGAQRSSFISLQHECKRDVEDDISDTVSFPNKILIQTVKVYAIALKGLGGVCVGLLPGC
jgi:hypothetical protein